MNIDGVKGKLDFEVIEIIDNIDPYPDLMGIDWAFDNLVILKLKKREMVFDSEDLRVAVPLDICKGEQYFELVREDLDKVDLNHFYKVTMRCEDYINPTTDGNLN